MSAAGEKKRARMNDKVLRPSWTLVEQVLAKGWILRDGKLTDPRGNWVYCEPVR